MEVAYYYQYDALELFELNFNPSNNIFVTSNISLSALRAHTVHCINDKKFSPYLPGLCGRLPPVVNNILLKHFSVYLRIFITLSVVLRGHLCP